MTLTQDITSEIGTAPAGQAKKGTILQAAEVRENQRIAEDGQWEFTSLSCMTIDGEPEFCGTNDKALDGEPSDQDGMRFGIYGGVVCKTVGWDSLGIPDGIGTAFAAAEPVGIEAAFMRGRFVENPDHWDAPTDLTPTGGAVKPKEGLAILEGHAGWNYHFRPTIHMPRAIASLLAVDPNWWDGDGMVTPLGSKIAAGGGYDKVNTGPDGVEPDEGELWLYATGSVLLRRSKLIGPRDAVNMSTNERPVLIERAYIGSVDCYAAAVRVRLEA